MAKNDDKLECSEGKFCPPRYSQLITLSGHASGATADVTLDDFPTGKVPLFAMFEGQTAITFSAGTTTGVGLMCGDTNDPDGLIVNGAVTTLTNGQLSQAGGPGVESQTGRYEADMAGDGLMVRITPTGGAADCDEISAGAVWVHVYYCDPLPLVRQ